MPFFVISMSILLKITTTSKYKTKKFELLKEECLEDSISKYKSYGIQIFLKQRKLNLLGMDNEPYLEILSNVPNEMTIYETNQNEFFQFDTIFPYLLEDNGLTEKEFMHTITNLKDALTSNLQRFSIPKLFLLFLIILSSLLSILSTTMILNIAFNKSSSLCNNFIIINM